MIPKQGGRWKNKAGEVFEIRKIIGGYAVLESERRTEVRELTTIEVHWSFVSGEPSPPSGPWPDDEVTEKGFKRGTN